MVQELTEEVALPDDSSAEPIERWTAKRRATLVLSILKEDLTTLFSQTQ
jgi:hypothetical protein